MFLQAGHGRPKRIAADPAAQAAGSEFICAEGCQVPGEFGQVVMLNGAPRSGKSGIARAIQATFPGVWMNLGVDNYMTATPERFLPGIGLRPGGERPDMEMMIQTMYLALYESIAAHSRRGLNTVADVGHHDGYSRSLRILHKCAAVTAGLPVLFVGVRCPVEAVMQRREDT